MLPVFWCNLIIIIIEQMFCILSILKSLTNICKICTEIAHNLVCAASALQKNQPILLTAAIHIFHISGSRSWPNNDLMLTRAMNSTKLLKLNTYYNIIIVWRVKTLSLQKIMDTTDKYFSEFLQFYFTACVGFTWCAKKCKQERTWNSSVESTIVRLGSHEHWRNSASLYSSARLIHSYNQQHQQP